MAKKKDKPIELETKTETKKKTAPKSEPKKTKKADEPRTQKSSKPSKPEKVVKAEKAVDAAPPSSKLIHQFLPFILWVVAILLLTCLFVHNVFDSDMGIAGNAIGIGLGGLFGLSSFLVPLLIVYLAITWHKLVDSGRLGMKAILSVVTLVFTATLLHSFGVQSAEFDVAYLWTHGVALGGGGVLGGLFCELLFILFERIGTIIISVTCLVIALMFLFNITPKNIYTFIRYKAKLARERRAIYLEEQKAKREAEQLEMEQALLRERKRQLSEEPAPKKPEPEPVDNDYFAEFTEPECKPIEETVKPKPAKPEKPEKRESPVDIMDEMPEKKEPSVPENVALGVIFNGDEKKSKMVSIDLPPVSEKREEPKKAPTEPAPAKKPAKKADEVKVSMKVDTEALSELENLRGGDATVEEAPQKDYVFPPTDLMKSDTNLENDEEARAEMNENAKILRETLQSFNIGIKDNILCSRGPTITRYELRPEVGVRVRSIANLVDDISLSLASSGVRIEAPIPNKPYVGIEVPNHTRLTVFLRTLIEHEKFTSASSKLTACLGADVGGNPVFFDISKMPHLLIAGATGMGKSVCINSIIVSLLYKATPDEVKLILIDPKKVEFNIYKDIPHLYAPIVSDPKKAAGALASAVAEMDRRFEMIEEVGVRDINSYNAVTADDPTREYMPKMVIIIDELADLMMTAPGEVESSICRLAQKARAAGIHIIIGTQRPSVDVITGLIKANVPSRIACTVASQVDSRTIIDIAGAEKLIGRGDMLFAPVGISKPMRVQGAFISEGEVESIVEFIKANNAHAEYNKEFISTMESESAKVGNKKGAAGGSDEGGSSGETDPKFREAVKLAIESQKISTSLMQRMLGVGYGRAAKIIDQMEDLGYVSAPDGNKPRKVLITMQEYMEKVINDDIEGGASAPDEEEE